MKSITSLHNNEIKNLVSLRAAKERNRQGLFIAEGIRTLSTLFDGGITIETIYITEKNESQALKIFPADKIIVVSDQVMHKISEASQPSGFLGVFKIPAYKSDLTPGIVLADITDPGNMGTLIRTAVACGLKTVISIEGTDPWSSKVVQSTAGNIASVNLFQYSWSELLENKNDLLLYALVVQKGESIKTVNPQKALLVIGNEAHGIKNEWLTSCDHSVTLPMHPNTESLNAAIAGSIALYITHMGC